MAKNLRTVITRKQAIHEFELFVLPAIMDEYEYDGVPDLPARREAWNNWTDGLCRDMIISDWQYENWSQPASCNYPWK